MAPRIQRLPGLIAGCALVLLVAPAPSGATGLGAAADPGNVITVPVPSGVRLPPGRYHVEVSGDGKGFATDIEVKAPPLDSSGQPVQGGSLTETPPAPTSGSTPTLLIVALVLALLGIAGILLYLKVYQPRRQIRPYRETLRLLDAERYHEALPALTKVEGTLPAKLRADARFFISFALYKLRKFDEAEHTLAALHRESPKDANVAYLLAYLRTERRDYDGAEPVLEAIESAGTLNDSRSRRLLGVIKFQRALEAMQDGRIEAASELFEKVERLGDFADQIPSDLRNRHMVLGAQALFDKDVVAARKQFESLEEAAGRLDPEQRGSMLASAKLGMALAAWIESKPDSPAAIESLLVDAVRQLDPADQLEQDWAGTDGVQVSLAERLAALEGKKTRSAAELETDRVLRDIHFLRGVAILRDWAAADERTAAAREAAYRTAALRRFAAARARDAEFSDVHVVVGLLNYYLAETDVGRAEGLQLLRWAQTLGTRDPEVLQILNHHARLDEARQDAVSTYLQVLDRYAKDGTVREEVRVTLIQQLVDRYPRMRGWDTRPELMVRFVPPTVAEINDRSALLLERVTQLVAARPGADDAAAAQEATRRLVNESKALSEQARSVEKTEAELLTLVADQLLPDGER